MIYRAIAPTEQLPNRVADIRCYRLEGKVVSTRVSRASIGTSTACTGLYRHTHDAVNSILDGRLGIYRKEGMKKKEKEKEAEDTHD